MKKKMWTIKWTKKNYYKVSQKIGRSFYVIVISEGECKNRKTSDKIGAVGISAHSTMSKSCQFFYRYQSWQNSYRIYGLIYICIESNKYPNRNIWGPYIVSKVRKKIDCRISPSDMEKIQTLYKIISQNKMFLLPTLFVQHVIGNRLFFCLSYNKNCLHNLFTLFIINMSWLTNMQTNN